MIGHHVPFESLPMNFFHTRAEAAASCGDIEAVIATTLE